MRRITSFRWALAHGALLLLLGCGESATPRQSEAIDRSREPAGTGVPLWVEEQRLVVQNSMSFGHVVAMSETTAIIGNRQHGIYAYTLSDGEWVDPQELVVEGVADGVGYGMSAAVSGDTAIIGMPESLERASAHVFTRTASGWAPSTPPFVGDPMDQRNESFGAVVAIEGDLALVGSPLSESVYVFVRSGDAWTQVNRLDRETASQSSGFGAALGISGNLVVVGAPRAGEAGEAYAYTKPSDLSSPWPQPDILVADVLQDFDQFGISVAVEGDTVLVGAAPRDSGAVYAFTKLASGWSPPEELLPDRNSSNDSFGHSVAISGARMVIGTPSLPTESGVNSGGVYVLARTGNSWNEEQLIVGPRSVLFFGRSVGISGDRIVVGAPSETFGVDGAAYAYRRLLDLGSTCETNQECGSGHCVSNVCCDTACVLECEECSTGTCEPVRVGSEGALSSSPYLCDGSRRDRPASCVTDDDCIGTHYCSDRMCTGKGMLGDDCSGPDQCLSEHCLAGRCSGTLPNSSPCTAASTCDSGNCVDGVCCDEACGGQCEACDVPRREGRCTPVTGEPHGDRTPCAGAGTICEGTCNGELSDVCAYPTDQCDSTCEDGKQTVSACDGRGECVEGETPRPCLEYVCDEEAVACRSSCEVDEDCAGDRRCWADGSCEPSPRCTLDGLSSETAPGEIFEDCGLYACAEGSCKTSCASPDDCAPPNACNANQRCVPPASNDDGGCGCRTASRAGTPAWAISASLVILAFARRRARHRAFRVGSVG